MTSHAARPAAAAASPSDYYGHSDGSDVYANAVDLGATGVATAEVSQAAAGVDSTGVSLAKDATDSFGLSLLSAATGGKTSYGHGAGVGVGLLSSKDATPAVKLTTVEATSPASTKLLTGDTLDVPLAPVATADVLPGTAQASTNADNSCVTSGPISTGTSHVANADVLTAGVVNVVGVGGSVENDSLTQLVKPSLANGTVVSSPNAGLETQTTETLAPITLFQGTPAAITITLLAPLRLAAEAGGQPGTSVISYAPVGLGPTDDLVTITAAGQTEKLTTQQVLGTDGVDINLGVATIAIGGPAHALDGLSGTLPTTAANGTDATAAADFIRIQVAPTTAATVGAITDPAGNGPLGGVLNPVLTPVISALSPVTTALESALSAAKLSVADIAVGHLEATADVPPGGIVCPSTVTTTQPNPLSESRKDVSASTVPAGQTFTYDLRIPNRGTAPITDVTAVDTFAGGPPSLQFVSSVPAPASSSGNTLTYDLGTLQPNAFDTVILTFRIPAGSADGTVYSNSAVISGVYDGTPVTYPVSVSGPTVGPTGTAGCTIYSSKFASNTEVTTGENFGYLVNVYNGGNTPCADTVVTDPLISGVTFVSCTDSCTNSGQDVTWSLGTLGAGQSEVVEVTVHTVATSGTLPNTAHTTTTSGAPSTATTGGPTVTDVSVPNDGVPASGTPTGKLAFTGLNGWVPIVALVLLVSAGGAYSLRRRYNER